MSYFFLLFYGKMIRVIYAMFVIAIKDLKVYIGNLNLPLGENAIWFELLGQKNETGKQMAGALYYQY